MTLDPAMSGLHHRGVKIIVAACHYGRVQRHAKKEAAIVATTTKESRNQYYDGFAIEDRKSDSGA